MEVKFDKILTTKAELERFNRNDPNNVAALLIHTFCNYNPNNTNEFFEMLQYLYGEFQPLSPLMKQSVQDRMKQNEKYKFIGKSYFKGANPNNDYTPTEYTIDVTKNPYSEVEGGYLRLFLKSGGADTERPVTLRLAKDGNYYIWSDSCMGLLSDIREPESNNPWA